MLEFSLDSLYLLLGMLLLLLLILWVKLKRTILVILIIKGWNVCQITVHSLLTQEMISLLKWKAHQLHNENSI